MKDLFPTEAWEILASIGTQLFTMQQTVVFRKS